MHRLYRVAPNFQLPVDLAELDVSVQHERLCSATARIPASRHHDAPSVAACPGRTVGKRLARVTMRLEGRGGDAGTAAELVKVWMQANVCLTRLPCYRVEAAMRDVRSGDRWGPSAGVAG